MLIFTFIKKTISSLINYWNILFSDGNAPSLGRYISAYLIIHGVHLLYLKQIEEARIAIYSGVGLKAVQNGTESYYNTKVDSLCSITVKKGEVQ